MPIDATAFEEGKSVERKELSAVMDPEQAYTTPEVSDLIGRSWGIAKNQLLEAEEAGDVIQKKIGRSVYWRFIGEPTEDTEE